LKLFIQRKIPCRPHIFLKKRFFKGIRPSIIEELTGFAKSARESENAITEKVSSRKRKKNGRFCAVSLENLLKPD